MGDSCAVRPEPRTAVTLDDLLPYGFERGCHATRWPRPARRPVRARGTSF
jgi:hypothetical protein